GSKGARPSPRLIATCYVLHRLSVPRHPPNALIALDPKLLKRHAQRQVPAPFALASVTQHFSASPTAGICNGHEHRTPTLETQCRGVAKDPAYGQPHFPIHDVKDRDELAIAVGRRPSIDRQLAITFQTLRTPPRSSSALLSIGGADRTRTGDPLLAKQALSQLSYSPSRFPGYQMPSIGSSDPRHLASENWWAREDLNFRPHAYQARALTN